MSAESDRSALSEELSALPGLAPVATITGFAGRDVLPRKQRPGLQFIGYQVVPSGVLREIGIEARRL